MGIAASMILTYSWLKFTDILLYTMYVVHAHKHFNVEILGP